MTSEVEPVAASTWITLVLAVVLIAGGLAVAGRARDVRASERTPQLRSLAWALAIGCAVALSFMLLEFRLLHDDYTYLLDADGPFRFDQHLRLVSVRLAFWASHQLEAPSVFLVFNGLGYGAVLAAAAMLARQLGATRHEAWIAALIAGLHPGFFGLVRWAAGFQHLAGLAIVLVGIAVFDRARQEQHPRRAAGLWATGVGLALLAVVTKFQVAPLMPLGALILALRSGERERDTWRVAAPLMLVGVLIVVPLLAGGADLTGGRMGAARIASNALEFSASWFDRWRVLLVGILILLVVRGFEARPGERRARVRSLAAAAARSRSSRVPTLALCAALALAFTMPFLLNASYFASYYLVYPAIFGSIAFARLVAVLMPTNRSSIVVALLLAAALFPYRAVADSRASRPENLVEQWLGEAASALAGSPPPRVIQLVAVCAGDDETRRSQVLLERYYQLSEQGDGLLWRTGYGRASTVVIVPANVAAAADSVRLRYCDSERPRFRLAPARLR